MGRGVCRLCSTLLAAAYLTAVGGAQYPFSSTPLRLQQERISLDFGIVESLGKCRPDLLYVDDGGIHWVEVKKYSPEVPRGAAHQRDMGYRRVIQEAIEANQNKKRRLRYCRGLKALVNTVVNPSP